jgi:hypothetical protein
LLGYPRIEDIEDSTGTERARCDENDASLADAETFMPVFAVPKSIQ